MTTDDGMCECGWHYRLGENLGLTAAEPDVLVGNADTVSLPGWKWNERVREVERLRAEVDRLRSVGEDDIATWAEYVTGKKWAPVPKEEET